MSVVTIVKHEKVTEAKFLFFQIILEKVLMERDIHAYSHRICHFIVQPIDLVRKLKALRTWTWS
jgi:hypothetical protein